MSKPGVSHPWALCGALLACAILAGCVPAPTTYWRPAAPEGRLERAWCPPDHSVLVWERDGVEIGVRADHYSDTLAYLRVGIGVAEGHVVELDDRDVEVVLPGEAARRLMLVGGKDADSGDGLVLHGPLDGTSSTETTFHGRFRGAFHVLTAELQRPGRGPIEVHFPPITVDGEALHLQPVRFDHVREWKIQSLNC